MSSIFGHVFKVSTWGESHGKAVGVVIDGCPPMTPISEEDIQLELDKRRPGQSHITTARKEADKVTLLSGIFEGYTTGTPIAMIVYNEDQRSRNYDAIKDLFRPGHADYTYLQKYGIRDYRGGGRSSGRETVARVAAGAVAKKVLSLNDIHIYAYTKGIGEISSDKTIWQENLKGQYSIDNNLLNEIAKNPIRTIDKELAADMEKLILEVKESNNSIGGIVEAVVHNVPPGLGEPAFDKLDADIAKALMSIGAVKGIEFGDGFQLARMRGDEANDQFINRQGKIVTATNHSGGVLGGISNGMPIVVRLAVKPTPSIAQNQTTVNLSGEEVTISTKGRHDPCIVPRIVPVIENMLAITLCDHFLKQKIIKTVHNDRENS